MVQNRLSLHGIPSFLGMETHTAIWQTPWEQPVGGLPSLHGMPSFLGTAAQAWPAMQVPTAHSLERTEQSTGGPLRHCPVLHVPSSVQGSMSSHWAPSLPTVDVQESVVSSQVPIWQASGGI